MQPTCMDYKHHHATTTAIFIMSSMLHLVYGVDDQWYRVWMHRLGYQAYEWW